MLLGSQSDIRPETPMPVDSVDNSAIVSSITGETATFYYNNSGVLTLATGQAIGTVIYAKLTYDGILNALASTVGNANDSGFAFVTGTVLTTKVATPGQNYINDLYQKTLTQKFTDVGSFLANGEYFVDHSNGCIWGKAAALVATDTCNYKVKTITSSTTLAASDGEIGAVELKDGATDNRAVVNAANTARAATDKVLLVQNIDATGAVAGGATGYAEDSVHVSGDSGIQVLARRSDTPTSSSGTEGDYSTLNTDANGKLWVRPDGGAASGTTDLGNPIKVGGKYNSTAPVLIDGQRGDMQLDSSANVKNTLATLIAGEDGSNNLMATQNRKIAAATYSPLLFTNFAANATLNVKASPGNVCSIYHHNLNAAARYFQLHNTATTPGGAAVPLMTFLVPAGAALVLGEDFFGQAGLNFTTGIAFAHSTTEGTYTAGTATDQFTELHYI